jgi:hypothetical protein
VEELKQQNIVVTPVQAKAQALQHAKAADALEKFIGNVPHAADSASRTRFILRPFVFLFCSQ